MKELSAHMDNVVKRLLTFFPLDDTDTKRDGGETAPVPPPVEPDLPPLALPPPNNARDSSASARVLTMDRAVSARRLLTDRAVSVASGLHFEDDISGATGQDGLRQGLRWRHATCMLSLMQTLFGSPLVLEDIFLAHAPHRERISFALGITATSPKLALSSLRVDVPICAGIIFRKGF